MAPALEVNLTSSMRKRKLSLNSFPQGSSAVVGSHSRAHHNETASSPARQDDTGSRRTTAPSSPEESSRATTDVSSQAKPLRYKQELPWLLWERETGLCRAARLSWQRRMLVVHVTPRAHEEVDHRDGDTRDDDDEEEDDDDEEEEDLFGDIDDDDSSRDGDARDDDDLSVDDDDDSSRESDARDDEEEEDEDFPDDDDDAGSFFDTDTDDEEWMKIMKAKVVDNDDSERWWGWRPYAT